MHLVITNKTTKKKKKKKKKNDLRIIQKQKQDLIRSSFQLDLHRFLHLRCICMSYIRYFWKTEVDLIISQLLKTF